MPPVVLLVVTGVAAIAIMVIIAVNPVATIIVVYIFLADFPLIWLGMDRMHEEVPLKSILLRADLTTIQEIVREAEVYLGAQLQAGIAADQRAVTFASVVGAVAAVLVGGFVAAAYGDSGPGNLGWIVFPGVMGLLVSMALATWAGRPVDWHHAGTSPKHWRPDVEKSTSLEASLAGQAALYAQSIDDNNVVLNRNAGLMMWAQRIAAVSIFTSIGTAAGLAYFGCL